MAQNSKIILGLVGEIASGKDTMADYLKAKYDSQTVSFSEPLRDILDRIYLPQSRINMANLGKKLRELFGEDILSLTIAKEAEASPKKIVCLPNVRLEGDIIHLSKMSGFVLVGINTDINLRYERLVNRNQNSDDRTKTWEQFLKDAELPTEVMIKEMIKKAPYQLDNNGTKEDFYNQIDELIRKIER